MLCLLLCLLFLAACAPQPEESSWREPASSREESSRPRPEPPLSESAPEPLEPSRESPPPESQPPPDPEEEAFWTRLEELEDYIAESTEPEEVLWAYFELQYLSYSALRQVDMVGVLDSDINGNMYNLDIWQKQLIQRRWLLEETGLCYVEQEQFPYEIVYLDEKELTDQRMDFWADFAWEDKAELTLHFTIRGEQGRAYPPLMAVNSQHTVRMRRENGSWKITFHYFPGARRKFYQMEYRYLRPDEEVLEELYREFEEYDDSTPLRPGEDSAAYKGRYAAQYARIYAEEPNPGYYHVGDWNGNCMNFVSQCILHGFGSGKIPDSSLSALMTGDWFSGGGGGTLAWENVDYFWEFATRQNSPMRCQVLQGPARLRTGDVVQTRSTHLEENGDPDDFNHCLLVVEGKTLLLAQNTPANFVYYSDLVNTRQRLLRPLYLG